MGRIPVVVFRAHPSLHSTHDGPPDGGHYVNQSRVRALVVAAVAIALVILGATPVRVLLVAAIVSSVLPIGSGVRRQTDSLKANE